MKTRLFKSVMVASAVTCVAAGITLSQAWAEDAPPATLQPGQQVQPANTETGLPESVVDFQDDGTVASEPIALFLGEEAKLLEFKVYQQEEGVFEEYADPDAVTVRYWGDGDAIALLQDVAWSFDIDASENRTLPLGVAPLSADTAPNRRSLAAVAVVTTSEGSVILMGDESGLVGVRTSSAMDVVNGAVEVVVELGSRVVGIIACTASVGECSCSASGQTARCKKWNASGKSWAECSDSSGAIRCQSSGNKCSCWNVAV